MSTDAVAVPDVDADQTVEGWPRVIDPGGDDWAEEPKVSESERMLYGEMAGIVRYLGQAAVSAERAYSLACKHCEHSLDSETEQARIKIAREAWDTFSEVRRVYSNTAAAVARDRDVRFRGTIEDDHKDLQVNMGGPVSR